MVWVEAIDAELSYQSLGWFGNWLCILAHSGLAGESPIAPRGMAAASSLGPTCH